MSASTQQPLFVLFLQRNWGPQSVTGDKMVAYVYNQIPDVNKSAFQVYFITDRNIQELRSQYRQLKDTPALINVAERVSTESGENTLFAMMHIAMQMGARFRLADLHPQCAMFDQKFQQMLQSQAPAQTSALASQQLPRDKDQLIAYLREYKKARGSVPIELLQQAEQIVQQSKGITTRVDYAQLNKANPKVREEISKLGGATLDDLVQSNESLRHLNLPFVDYSPNDSYEPANLIGGIDSIASQLDVDELGSDTLSRRQPPSIDDSLSSKGSTSSLGISDAAVQRLAAMRMQIESKAAMSGAKAIADGGPMKGMMTEYRSPLGQ